MRRFPALLVLALSLLAVPALAAGGHRAGKLRVHVVYRGQTLGMIAKRYHVSIAALCHANGIRRSTPIKPSQKLVIPARDDRDGSRARKRLERRRARSHSGRRASLAEAHKGRTRSGRRHSYARRPRHRGYLILHSGAGSWRGYAVRHGKLTHSAEQQVSQVLASWRTGKKKPINPRLIQMLARVSDHFGGRPIRVVSGFRPYRPTQYTPHSRHNLGRAVDFSIPGVPNEVLRDYCRTLPRVGCGYYPNSSFVHMDVRRISAYWVDQAGPGQPPRYSYVGGPETTDADEGASDSAADAASRKSHHRASHGSHHRAPSRKHHVAKKRHHAATKQGGSSAHRAAHRSGSTKTHTKSGKTSGKR